MTVVDDYLAALSGPQKAELERVCKIVRSLVPEAEEAKSYGVPAFKFQGKLLVGFAANKNFLSIYPASGAIEDAADKLTKFAHSKGAVQFTPENPLPDSTLKQIIKYRLGEIKKNK